MRASDYIGISEKIRSNEIKLQGELSEINGKISSLYSRIDSLESELQILQMELNAALSETDEEGNVDMGAVSAIRSRMNAVYSQINSCQSEISNYESEKKRIETELQSVEIEKQATLSEIQSAASVKSQNISKLASGLSGDYANIGQNLQSAFQVSLGHLSQAASILGGTIAVSSGGGNSGGGSSSTGRWNPRISSNIAAVGGTGSKNRPSVSASNLSVKPVGATGFGGKSSIQSKLTPVASSTKQGSTGQLQSASKVSLPKVANSGGASMTSLPSTTSTNGAVNISSTFSARGITTIADKEVVSGSESPFSASPHTFRDYLNPVNYDSNGHYTGNYRSPDMQTAQAVVDYNNWNNNGGIGLPSIDWRQNGGAIQTTVPAQNIFDVYDADNPNFWSYKSRPQSDYIAMATYIPLVRQHLESGKTISEVVSMGGVLGACATNYFRDPVKVMKAGQAYIHCNDGRHRTVAAQIAKVEMPVCVVQEFSLGGNSQMSDLKSNPITPQTNTAMSPKLNAGTGTFHSSVKNLAKSNATNFDSNGDAIDVENRNSWDYGHTTGFEKRHLESFGYLIGLSQQELSTLMNSTIMVEIQNRGRNRDHSAEESDFTESMRWILMSNWDHLPSDIQEKFSIIGNDIIYHNQGVDVILTPSSIDELIDNQSVRNAFLFDAKLSKVEL